MLIFSGGFQLFHPRRGFPAVKGHVMTDFIKIPGQKRPPAAAADGEYLFYRLFLVGETHFLLELNMFQIRPDDIVDSNTVHIRELDQKLNIGDGSPRFPFRHRLTGDVESAGEVILGNFIVFPQFRQELTDFYVIQFHHLGCSAPIVTSPPRRSEQRSVAGKAETQLPFADFLSFYHRPSEKNSETFRRSASKAFQNGFRHPVAFQNGFGHPEGRPLFSGFAVKMNDRFILHALFL